MNHDESVWSVGASSDPASQHSVASVGSRASRSSAASVGHGSAASTRSGSGAYAAPLDRSDADLSCCTFQIGGQLFGLDVGAVGEVFQVERVVRVPLAPPGVLGLTNLRGAAIAVVDLAAVLGLQVGGDGAPIDGRGPALVVRLQGMRFAASIDLVDSVFPVRSNAIKESDAVGEHPAIAGFLPLADGRVVSVVDTVVLAEHVQRLRLRQSTDNGRDDGLASE
jgi:purine-binding chemotaxis protein CheW